MNKVAEKRITRVMVAVLSVMMVFTSMPMLAYAATNSEVNVKYVYGDKDNPSKKTGIESVTMDGIQYYDINQGLSDNNAPAKDNQIAFYKAALSATPSGSDKSVLNQWAEIAEALIKANKDYAYQGEFDEYSSVFNTSIAAALSEKNERKEHIFKEYTMGDIHVSGLQYANNLNAVRKASATNLRTVINRKDVDSSCDYYAESNKDFFLDNSANAGTSHQALNDTKTQDVIYTMVTSFDDSYANVDYNSFVLAFYDFKLVPLAGEGLEYITAAEGYESIQAAKESNVPGVKYNTNTRGNQHVSYYKNNSKVDNSISATFDESSTESISNSTSSSETYEYSSTIGEETSIGTTIKPLTQLEISVAQKVSYSTTTGETLSTAWSDTKSLSNTTSNTITSSLVLPAHTAVEILSYSGESNMALDYDCPVALEYKVAISSLSGELDKPMLTPYKKSFSTVFGIASDGSLNSALGGESAIDNLYNRAVKNANDAGFEKTYGQAYMWSNHIDQKGDNANFNKIVKNSEKAKNSSDWLVSHVPMSSAASTISYSIKSQGQETGNVVPLYPIYAIITTNARKSGEISFDERFGITSIADYINAADMAEGIDVESGGRFYTNQLITSAYNQYYVPFFGFDHDRGRWERVVKNAEGKWVLDDNEYNDNLAKNVVSPTGSEYIQFGDISKLDPEQLTIDKNEDGEYEVYFQYFIDDDRYTSLEGADQNTNDKIYREVIKLNIGENRFDGTVKLEGDYTGYADGETANLNEELNVCVLDENGKEVAVPITWECKSKSGIKLTTDGEISFGNAGTYQVRAKSGEAVSDWITVTAKAARVVSGMEFALPEFTTYETKLTNGRSTLSYDFASFLQFKDQYGDKWTGSRPENLEYKLDDDYTGAYLNNGVLTVTEPGTYKVFAINGNDRNSATIEIKDSRSYKADVSTDELSEASAELDSDKVDRNGTVELTITPNKNKSFENAPKVKLSGTAVLGKLRLQDDGSYKCKISDIQSDITASVAGKAVAEGEYKIKRINVPETITVNFNKQPVNLYQAIDVSVENEYGKILEKEYTWDAKETAVKIDSDGALSVEKEGTYHVQAISDGVHSDWITLVVKKIAPTKTNTFSAAITESTAYIGKRMPEIIATAGDNAKLSYAVTSGSKYATIVEEDGRYYVKALKAGTAKVTVTAAATADYKKASKTIKVTVKSPTNINSSKLTTVGKVVWNKGEAVVPSVTVKSGKTTFVEGKDYTVKLTNPSGGEITSWDAGETIRVTVDATDKDALVCKGTFTKDVVIAKATQPATATVPATLYSGEGKEPVKIEIEGIPSSEGDENPSISCVSSKPTIASVTNDGVITPLKAGKATITVNIGATQHYAAKKIKLNITVKAATNISNGKLVSVKAGYNDGEKVVPVVTVKGFKEDVDFTYEYTEAKNIGDSMTVTVKAVEKTGGCIGECTKTVVVGKGEQPATVLGQPGNVKAKATTDEFEITDVKDNAVVSVTSKTYASINDLGEGKYSITGIKKGTATVTVKIAATDKYNAKTISFKVKVAK